MHQSFQNEPKPNFLSHVPSLSLTNMQKGYSKQQISFDTFCQSMKMCNMNKRYFKENLLEFIKYKGDTSSHKTDFQIDRHTLQCTPQIGRIDSEYLADPIIRLTNKIPSPSYGNIEIQKEFSG